MLLEGATIKHMLIDKQALDEPLPMGVVLGSRRWFPQQLSHASHYLSRTSITQLLSAQKLSETTEFCCTTQETCLDLVIGVR